MNRILASKGLRERLLIWENYLYVVLGIRAMSVGELRLVQGSYCYLYTTMGGAFIYPPGQGPSMIGRYPLRELDIEQYAVEDLGEGRLLVIPRVQAQ